MTWCFEVSAAALNPQSSEPHCGSSDSKVWLQNLQDNNNNNDDDYKRWNLRETQTNTNWEQSDSVNIFCINLHMSFC